MKKMYLLFRPTIWIELKSWDMEKKRCKKLHLLPSITLSFQSQNRNLENTCFPAIPRTRYSSKLSNVLLMHIHRFLQQDTPQMHQDHPNIQSMLFTYIERFTCLTCWAQFWIQIWLVHPDCFTAGIQQVKDGADIHSPAKEIWPSISSTVP